MHPHAQKYLDQIESADLRAKMRTFFDAYDRMDRENAHLRLAFTDKGYCPYGHFSPTGGCALGYPGCACMDDMLALQSWSPEDEQRAAMRIGRMLFATRNVLEAAQQALVGAALALESRNAPRELVADLRRIAGHKVVVFG